MIHDKIEGLIPTIGGIFFGGISIATVGSIVGIVSGILAMAASCMAIRYYYFATKKQR